MKVQEHKAFKQILVNREEQRYSACERILKDHGIEVPVFSIRRIYQNIIRKRNWLRHGSELSLSWSITSRTLEKSLIFQ
ncbi:MAG: hypothetical protein AB1403_02600 [Candidatus Riflebacteria bacterium]